MEKFLFDYSFDQPDSPHALSRVPMAAPEPIFTLGEVNAGREAAYSDGHAAALAEAKDLIEKRAADAMEILGQGLKELLDGRAALEAAIQRDAIAIVRTVLRKALPAYCRAHSLSEIDALVAECLREAHDEPRIILRVSEAIFPEIRDRLGRISALAGYSGKLMLQADAAIADGDCRIEWGQGGVERDTERLEHEIEAAITRAIEATRAENDMTPAMSFTEENVHERSA